MRDAETPLLLFIRNKDCEGYLSWSSLWNLTSHSGSRDLEPSSAMNNQADRSVRALAPRLLSQRHPSATSRTARPQLRRPEAKNAHPEDTELRKAVNGEAPAPAKLLQWREQLAALPPGRQVSFEGLRPTERYALHQLANEFQLTHMSTGAW